MHIMNQIAWADWKTNLLSLSSHLPFEFQLDGLNILANLT